MGTKKGLAQQFLSAALNHQGDGCLIWPFAKDSYGYGSIRFDGRTRAVPSLVCEIVKGVKPSSVHEAAHSCGDRSCCAPAHLSWKTHAGNMADMIAHGKSTRGERSPTAKLSAGQVSTIKSLIGRLKTTDIAKIFGVNRETVRCIKLGKSWVEVR